MELGVGKRAVPCSRPIFLKQPLAWFGMSVKIVHFLRRHPEQRTSSSKTLFHRSGLCQATWFLSVSPGRAYPERDMHWLHGFLDDVEQVLTQLAQVYLIA
jgi:hypothetical protein